MNVDLLNTVEEEAGSTWRTLLVVRNGDRESPRESFPSQADGSAELRDEIAQ